MIRITELDVAKAYHRYRQAYDGKSPFDVTGENILSVHIKHCQNIAHLCNSIGVHPTEYFRTTSNWIRQMKNMDEETPVDLHYFSYPSYQQLYINYHQEQINRREKMKPVIQEAYLDLVISLMERGIPKEQAMETARSVMGIGLAHDTQRT